MERCGWASAAVWLLACDPSVFDRETAVSQSASVAPPADAGAHAAMIPDAGAALPAVDAGSAAGHADAATSTGAGAGSVAAAIGGNGGMVAAGASASGAGRGPVAGSAGVAAADGGRPPQCPRLPTTQDESLCYDFESGVRGPNGGDTYDLWPNPELASAAQLTVVAMPGSTDNQVLQATPTASASDASAALGHSTRHFDRATAEFDIWVSDALVNTSEEVSWFRYVPVDGDDVHVTALIFRRGQALLRSESSSTEYPLRKLPSTDGAPAHISVHLQRGAACSVEVALDGEVVASAPQGACVGDASGFVEYGLVMLDAASGAISAAYDDVAFTREP